jgi:hypothetical protein
MRYRDILLSLTLGIILTAGLVLALGSSSASAAVVPERTLVESSGADHSDVISAALDYIGTRQQPDGGIDAYGLGSSEGPTGRALLAVVAAGRPATWTTYYTTGKSMVDYLAARAITYTHDVTGELYARNAGLLLAAAAAANEDPHSFGGMDLVAEIEDTYRPPTGAYSNTAKNPFFTGAADAINQWWPVFGLAAAGETVPVSATEFLIGLQNADGGWGDDFWAGGSDIDTTAGCVVALIASGNVSPTDQAVQDALDFFGAKQLGTGGWRPGWDADPVNVDSTGWVIQALVAAGYTPATESWAKDSSDPHDALLSMTKADGSIGGTWANAFSTSEALYGLTEEPLFFLGRTIRARRALSWLNEQQNTDGSWSGLSGPDAGATCDAVLSYAAAGYDPDTVKAAGSALSAMDHLSNTASSSANESAAKAGKLALAVEAAAGDAHSFGGVNVVDVITSTWYSPTAGAYGTPSDTWDQAFAILGLAAAGETPSPTATQNLKDLQNPVDGSWVDFWGFSRLDTTGLVMQALVAAGVPSSDPSIISGTAYLAAQQNAYGSWNGWSGPDVNTTAYVMQGLLAAGEDLESGSWLKVGRGPFAGLAELQRVDGPFVYAGEDNLYATQQAVPALLGMPYPYPPTAVLTDFVRVARGPDPDRMVAVPPRAMPGGSIDVTIPFGSDADGDGSAMLQWREQGAASWSSGATVHRSEGYFTATLALPEDKHYEFRATFTDPDQVQYRWWMLGDPVTLPWFRTWLPLVARW